MAVPEEVVEVWCWNGGGGGGGDERRTLLGRWNNKISASGVQACQ